MIKSVKFVSIPVTDQDRALEFYTEKLGMTIMTDQPMGPGAQRWIELAVPGADTRVVLFTPAGHEDRIGGFSNVVFASDHVEKTHQQLRRAGRRVRPAAEEGALGNIGDLQGPGRQPVRAVEQVINH